MIDFIFREPLAVSMLFEDPWVTVLYLPSINKCDEKANKLNTLKELWSTLKLNWIRTNESVHLTVSGSSLFSSTIPPVFRMFQIAKVKNMTRRRAALAASNEETNWREKEEKLSPLWLTILQMDPPGDCNQNKRVGSKFGTQDQGLHHHGVPPYPTNS